MTETRDLPADGLKGLRENIKFDALSGFLVFLIALPLCLGIAKASGFPPIGGIYTAIIGGLVVSFFAGSPLTIKGPAAGLIVIALGSVTELSEEAARLGLAMDDPMIGYKTTLAVVVVSGLIQVAFGLLKLGTLADFFPSAAVHGMLASIGIIIISKQIHTVFGASAHGSEAIELLEQIPASMMHMNPAVFLIGGGALAILFGLTMIKKKWAKMIPGPMLVLLYSMPIGLMLHFNESHFYEFAGTMYAINPTKFLVDLPLNFMEGIVFPSFVLITDPISIKYIIMFSLVGSIESLLSAKAIDTLDPYKRKSNMNRDLLAIGIGNTLAGCVGGLPMISEIVRSSANINNGGRTRWVNFYHGAFLLVSVAFLAGVIRLIPTAALAGMLVFTGYRLASPKEFIGTAKVGWDQITIFVSTLIITLLTDLLIGIAAGVLVKMAIQVYMGASLKEMFKAQVAVSQNDDSYIVKMTGPAVFANWIPFNKKLGQIPKTAKVKLDMTTVSLLDHTFQENLHHLQEDFHHAGGHLNILENEKLVPLSAHPAATRRKDKTGNALRPGLTEREKELTGFAKDNGFVFSSVNDRDVRFRWSAFKTSNTIKYSEASISGTLERFHFELHDMVVNEITYGRPVEKNITLLYINLNDVKLPVFGFDSETIMDKLSDHNGINDIDFSEFPHFSSHYLLWGEDENEVKTLFDKDVIKYLEHNKGYAVECSGSALLISKNREQLDEEDMMELLGFAAALCERLTSR